MTPIGYIILFVTIFIFLVLVSGYAEKIKHKKQKEKEDDFIRSTNKFFLCSDLSIKYAISIIGKVEGLFDAKRGMFNSYKQLDCPKEDVIKCFYFLTDCVRFCKDKPIYANEELVSKIIKMYARVSMYFLDVPIESIPIEPIENYKFGKQFGLLDNFGEGELKDLALVDWRNSEQWEYWAKNKYGNNKLGEYCNMMAKNLKGVNSA